MDSPTPLRKQPFSSTFSVRSHVREPSIGRSPFKLLFDRNTATDDTLGDGRRGPKGHAARESISQAPVSRTLCAFSSPLKENTVSHSTTAWKPLNVNRKSPSMVGGSSTTLNRTFEERVEQFESNYAQISSELAASQEPFMRPRRNRYLLSDRPASMSQSDFDAPISTNGQNERSIKDEYITSLRKVRAQNVSLSRALRDQTARNASLLKELEEERASHSAVTGQVFSSPPRSTRTPTQPTASATKPYAKNWATKAADGVRSSTDTSPTISAKSHYNPPSFLNGSPRPISASNDTIRQLSPTAFKAARHAQEKLAISEERCAALSSKVSSLQTAVNTCIDQSSAAIQVERELRFEVETRVLQLLDENRSLKDEKDAMELELANARPVVQAWKMNSKMFEQIEDMAATVNKRQSLMLELTQAPALGITEVPRALEDTVDAPSIKAARQDAEAKLTRRKTSGEVCSGAVASQRSPTVLPGGQAAEGNGEWVKVVRGLVRSSQLGLLGTLTTQFLNSPKKPSHTEENQTSSPLKAATELTRSISKKVKRYLRVESNVLFALIRWTLRLRVLLAKQWTNRLYDG
ncbi:hypothetical protein PLICRDRAFT_124776 [Plicaturopsis crispa FD-325 SS-3]|nr:hypothetical protein PLICRDRAFT_124776 [Plicaturopsis crispa FD-325 SS-3]